MKGKNVKRLLAMGLCGVMAAGGLQAQASGESAGEVSLEGEELTIWAPIYWVGQTMTYEENEAWQKVQENLGIKLNFIHPAAGEEVEQFNI